MANPRAFISFDFDNNFEERKLFVGQTKNSRTPFYIQDWSSKKRLPEWKWEQLIEEKVNKCNLLIVLVGRRTHSATGVIKEIHFAHKHKVPVFGVYVDGANTTTTLPKGLTRGKTIKWTWDGISNGIDQCMNEGKNK